MKNLLLVDDEPRDLRLANEVASSLGVFEVVAQPTVERARSYLETGLAGKTPLPDAIVLDLDFGYESGFELLRFWHSTPRLTGIPLIVWSIVEEQREVCELFKVSSFVSKWQGASALRDALGRIVT